MGTEPSDRLSSNLSKDTAIKIFISEVRVDVDALPCNIRKRFDICLSTYLTIHHGFKERYNICIMANYNPNILDNGKLSQSHTLI